FFGAGSVGRFVSPHDAVSGCGASPVRCRERSGAGRLLFFPCSQPASCWTYSRPAVRITCRLVDGRENPPRRRPSLGAPRRVELSAKSPYSHTVLILFSPCQLLL